MNHRRSLVRRRLLRMLAASWLVPTAGTAEPVGPMLVGTFAPTGVLRASINLGNPVLANRPRPDDRPVGVSVDLAERLAMRLGVPLELVVLDAAGKSVEAVTGGQADVGFFAIDPMRGEDIAFTPAYVLIEGAYLVRDDSTIRDNDDVDREGRRVVVGKGSAYDLYLTRELRHATLERAATSPRVTDTFVESHADVAAGVRQQLEADARRIAGLRVLDGRFMVIEQAMGIARGRGRPALAFLNAFVEDAKGSGFVAASLARHRVDGALVAPPAGTL